MPEPAKILLLDIETAPNLGYVWGIWEQNVIEIERHWYMLSFGVKWLGKKKTSVFALPDYPGFKTNKEDDKLLVEELWSFLDEADVVVAHNGDRFDLRKTNARFIEQGLKPPSPYKTVDTLKIARRHFKFDSNKLDDLGKCLGVGRKLPHTGKHLWLGCMRGDEDAWKKMRRYNANDVDLLERVYLKLRPWATNHPNLTFFSRKGWNCPVCESANTVRRGFEYLRTGKRQRRTCNGCGHRYRVGRLLPLDE